MHTSLKQSPRGASSGSPDNALHSLVIYTGMCMNLLSILAIITLQVEKRGIMYVYDNIMLYTLLLSGHN